MKKLFMTLVAVALCGSAMAQTPEEKAALKAAQSEARSQMKEGIALRDEVNTLYNTIQTEQAKGEKAKQGIIDAAQMKIREKRDRATELLTIALASGHIEAKKLFDACKALDDVSAQLLNPELAKAAAKEDFDTLLFARAVDGVCQGCYGTIAYGNRKDVNQGPSVQMAEMKMPKLMIYYAYLCIFYTETKNIPAAAAALDKYANFAANYPLVANDDQVKNPQYPVEQFAFNLYYTAYQMKDVELCEKWYPMALQYDDADSHTFVTSSRPQLYKEMGDTVKWRQALLDVIDMYPGTETAETAQQNLLSIAGSQGREAMTKEADRQLSAYPNSKVANYGKGYSLFSQEKYEESVPYFVKALEIDPSYGEGAFMAGMALYRQALDNYYKYVDSKKYKTTAEMQAAEEKYVKSYFRKAKEHFENYRDLEPERKDDWAGPLQNIYKNLGENDKAKEMSDLLK